jgi:hypothetical protein
MAKQNITSLPIGCIVQGTPNASLTIVQIVPKWNTIFVEGMGWYKSSNISIDSRTQLSQNYDNNDIMLSRSEMEFNSNDPIMYLRQAMDVSDYVVKEPKLPYVKLINSYVVAGDPTITNGNGSLTTNRTEPYTDGDNRKYTIVFELPNDTRDGVTYEFTLPKYTARTGNYNPLYTFSQPDLNYETTKLGSVILYARGIRASTTLRITARSAMKTIYYEITWTIPD